MVFDLEGIKAFYRASSREFGGEEIYYKRETEEDLETGEVFVRGLEWLHFPTFLLHGFVRLGFYVTEVDELVTALTSRVIDENPAYLIHEEEFFNLRRRPLENPEKIEENARKVAFWLCGANLFNNNQRANMFANVEFWLGRGKGKEKMDEVAKHLINLGAITYYQKDQIDENKLTFRFFGVRRTINAHGVGGVFEDFYQMIESDYKFSGKVFASLKYFWREKYGGIVES